MNTLIKLIIPAAALALLSACVVVPARPYHYGYVGPAVVVGPAHGYYWR